MRRSATPGTPDKNVRPDKTVGPDTALGGTTPGPVRTCIACRRTFDKSRLTRFVRMGTRIEVDGRADRPGRGCYVCEVPECLEKALAKDGARLRRALRVGGDHATVEVEAVRAQWPHVERQNPS